MDIMFIVSNVVKFMEATQNQLWIMGIHPKMIKKSTPIRCNLTQNYKMLNFSKSKQKENTT